MYVGRMCLVVVIKDWYLGIGIRFLCFGSSRPKIFVYV